jgi:transposase, IS5 family
MLLLKHVRDWSYEILVREVRANLVFRQFTRVGSGSVPDDNSLGRLARTLGSDVVEQIHQRIVTIAREKKGRAG